MKQRRNEEGIIAFGQKLKALRKEHGLSQEKLAWEADMEPIQVSKIERGLHGAGLSMILELAKALKISPARFFEDYQD